MVVYITYKTLIPTMVDVGKMSKIFFNKLVEKNPENPSDLRFGLSVLHARIQFYECFLKFVHKIPLKKWQARTNEDRVADICGSNKQTNKQ